MKKAITILTILFCFSVIFSTAAAFQTQQDQLPGISSFFDSDRTGSERSVSSLTINSIQIYGEIDSDTQAVLDMLAGTRLEYSSQPGDAPRYSVDLSNQDTQILTFSLQRGTPYYIGSNFLGDNMYMIYTEDEFAEKLITAFYNLLANVSDDTSNLPDLDQLLAAVKAIKQGSIQVIPTESFQGLSLTQEINPSAFMEVLGDLMTRIGQAEPTAGIAYRYTDFAPENFSFEWPAESALPELTASASAITGTFYGTDIIKFVDCLPQFFADNPELTGAVNQIIIETMSQTDPEMQIPEGTDVVSELVSSVKESVQGLSDFYLTFKLDSDNHGSPVLITAEIGQPAGDMNQGVRLTIIPASGYPVTAVDAALDMFAGADSMPMFRALFVADSESLDSGLNFILAPSYDFKFEYAQHTATTENLFGSINTDTIIDYIYITGLSEDISGHASILSTAETNAFDGEDQTTQISYTQQMAGSPIFSVTVAAENKTVEGLPVLTPADAIHAADMTAENYEDLAGTIFLQIMMIMMNFM